MTAAFCSQSAPLPADAVLHVASPMGSITAQPMGSPVFLSMLDSGMVEGGAPEVEISEANPVALEMLLRHAYGAAVDVPLALAPQLYGLADRFQLRSDLAEQLLLWLSTVDVQPAALCELLPAAHALCPCACRYNLCFAAADAMATVAASPALGSWPVELVAAVVGSKPCSADEGFAAAAAWMAVQHLWHLWPVLLDALRWDKATHGALLAVRQHSSAASVLPPVYECSSCGTSAAAATLSDSCICSPFGLSLHNTHVLRSCTRGCAAYAACAVPLYFHGESHCLNGESSGQERLCARLD